jgi:hypothetical protein
LHRLLRILVVSHKEVPYRTVVSLKSGRPRAALDFQVSMDL